MADPVSPKENKLKNLMSEEMNEGGPEGELPPVGEKADFGSVWGKHESKDASQAERLFEERRQQAIKAGQEDRLMFLLVKKFGSLEKVIFLEEINL